MNEHAARHVTHQDRRRLPRVLVAIASHGTSNDRYLERVIREYGAMSLVIDIVVLSNIDKRATTGVECIVGLPARNPWSLPFAHKNLFAQRRDQYDLFIYSEDDILITERNIRAWLEVTSFLSPDEVAGFLRVEFGEDGERNYPDIHAHFHWDPSSVRRRGDYILAHFTNEHAACFVLTREQLAKALHSGRFDVAPHQGKYDLACTAATDPYTQCGLRKLVPISHLEDFTVHHLTNRYVGRMGIGEEELGRQKAILLQIAAGRCSPYSLLPTETRLRRAGFSKDYYEPESEATIALVPASARSVLSIGCGSGKTEKRLQARGLHVTAIPLDPVIAAGPAGDGIEMIYADLDSIGPNRDTYDCVLCLNLLHLAPDPRKLLLRLRSFMHERSIAVIQMPNTMSPRGVRSYLRASLQSRRSSGYEAAGVHFASARKLASWCVESGLRIEAMFGVPADHGDGLFGMTSRLSERAPRLLSLGLSASIIVTVSGGKPRDDRIAELASYESDGPAVEVRSC
ncbi:bifunctional 2-polyprenyl-6-hydroxyphenol methylase/3-demethylubiquinol 3-O-methyltransferase UbiG [Bradyrhizobium sp. PRIMUS42]|uniref:class I SAM-dependent methyltransferase n=1 Tax=Bradyrhizobium sp. PRIMUS42 TaxID=2908926 RepID=UPI001FF66C92|nr:class I SAM-dependent methyltransferase [Bradyrhizobium sp. PRIMUS42]MCJ9728744.1 class I SAM-dependent methyltransferase [Bradyrhizobium sp. PRIMUS42]